MSIGELIKIKKANFGFREKRSAFITRKSWRFALSDLALGFATLFFNPYRICRKKRDHLRRDPSLLLASDRLILLALLQ